jgi:hypothetical protein
MKSLSAPGSDRAPRTWRARFGREHAQWALLSPRSAVGFGSGEAFAQSLAPKVLQALRTAAALAPLGDSPQPVKGLHNRSSSFERPSPFSWACYIFGSLGELHTQLYNQAVDTDTQGRPRATRALFLGRRSLLR